MPRFKCWSPDDFCDDEDDAVGITAYDAEDAAAEWAEKRYEYDSCDWPCDSFTVHVRGDDGSLTQVEVTTEYEPSFSASEQRHGPRQPYPWERSGSDEQ